MSRRILIAIVSLVLALSSSGQAITVVAEGAKPAGWAAVEGQVNRQMGQGKSSAEAADLLKMQLVDEGYLDAVVSLMGDTMRVTAGERYQLRKLRMVADSVYQVGWQGDFTHQNLDAAIAASLQPYYLRGYYYARATVNALRREGVDITAVVSVNRGPIVTVGEMRYIGLSRTKRELLDKSLPAMAGDTLTEPMLASLEKAAGQLAYVVHEPPIVVKPRLGYTQADLELHFRERQQFVFSGGAGYSNEERAGLVWNLAVQMQNLFGEGKQVNAKSERREQGRNVLDIAYRQPSTLLGQGSLYGQLATRDYREQFYEFALTSGYDMQVSPELSAGLTLGWKRVEPTSRAGYSRMDVAFSLNRSQVDDSVNPGGGYSFVSSVGYSYRENSADSSNLTSSFNDTRATARADFYHHLAGAVVGHLAVGYRGLETKESLPPISELNLAGGPGTIRGYRNEQFAVRRIAFGSIEPRYRFRTGYLFGFIDAAFMQVPDPAVSGLREETKYGYGAGFALMDGVRGVKLSLGWNPEIAVDQPWLSVEFSAGL